MPPSYITGRRPADPCNTVMGNANHRRYYDVLLDHVQAGRLDPQKILTETEPMTGAIEAYKAFDERQPGWIKVELMPSE